MCRRGRLVVAMAANRSTAPLFEEEAQTFAHFFLDHGSAVKAEFDRDFAGAWTLTATMGDDMEHEGRSGDLILREVSQ